MTRALVVVDAQKDFVEGGSLAVEGGLEVAQNIHALMLDEKTKRYYKRIVATKDWHNREGDNGGHFHNSPDYADTWPGHCVAGTTGAEFAGGLSGLDFDDIFHKGWNEPAYSGFQGISSRNMTTSLDSYLKTYGVEEIHVCGIASTHCVKATVLDALDKGYTVKVLSQLTAGVGGYENHQRALKEMEVAGATII